MLYIQNIFYTFGNMIRLFLCGIFFHSSSVEMNTWQCIFHHKKPCAFKRICMILYELTAILMSLFKFSFMLKTVPLQTNLYSLYPHTLTPLGLTVYVSVLYYMSPFSIVLIQLQGFNITEGHPVFTE